LALKDKVSGVREQAVLLAGGLSDKYLELVQVLLIAAKDENMRVRFNTALVLGSLEGPGVINAMALIAARDGADQWVRAGVLSGIEKRIPEFLSAFKAQKNADPIAFSLVMQDLGRLLGNGGSVADSRIFMKDVLNAPSGMDWRVSSLLGLAEGASGRAKDFSSSSKGFIYALQGEQASDLQLDNFISATSKIAENPAVASAERVRAIALLGFTDFDRANKTLQKLLDPGNPPELLLGVVSSISRLNDARGAAMLTAKQSWSAYTPRLKSAVTSALVSKTIFIKELFIAIEKGDIKGAEISSADRTRLLSSKDVQVSDQAKLLFNELEGGDRMKVYQDYKLSLSASADGSLGKAAFQKSCSACHTYQKEGGKVGPDLTGVKNQPAEALLLHILVPNYEVLPAYQSVSVTTKDGRSMSGWLVSETENSLTLRTTFGTDEAVLRKNIATLGNSGLSLMPDGLEQNITKDEMAKLIAYLKGGS
jgi:putative heme-binding domain-containing protein